MIKLQASFTGYNGSPTTLLAVIDDDTGILVIANQIAYKETRHIQQKDGDGEISESDFTLISNVDAGETDFLFVDEMLRDAIRSFYSRKSQGMIDILEKLARYNPDNKIERDSVDEKGPSYKIMPDIENGQMAVLALTAFYERYMQNNTVNSAVDSMLDFLGIETI